VAEYFPNVSIVFKIVNTIDYFITTHEFYSVTSMNIVIMSQILLSKKTRSYRPSTYWTEFLERGARQTTIITDWPVDDLQ